MENDDMAGADEHTPLSARTNEDRFSSLEVVEPPVQEHYAPGNEGEHLVQAPEGDGKQVHQAPDLPPIAKSEGGYNQVIEPQSERPPAYLSGGFGRPETPTKRPLWKHKRAWIPVLAVIALLAIILPSVLATRRRNGTSNSDAAASGTPASTVSTTPSKPTATGTAESATTIPTTAPIDVMPGTRLSVMDPKTGGDIYLFYQAASGSIHFADLSPDRVWQGSYDLRVTDAKNQTPIASTYQSFSVGDEHSIIWQVFYVDTNDTIQSIFSSQQPTMWQEDTIGNHSYKVPDRSDITFAAAHGNKYNSSIQDIDTGIELYACSTNELVEAYTYRQDVSDSADDTSQWRNYFAFEGPTGCGSGAFTVNKGKAYVFTYDDQDTLEIWWYDYSNTNKNRDDWNESASSPSNPQRNGSVCASYPMFVYQGPNGTIQGSDIDWDNDASKTRWDTTYTITDEPVRNGTGLSCWHFNDGGKTLEHVFYQAEDNTIKEAIKDTSTSNWRFQDVPTR